MPWWRAGAHFAFNTTPHAMIKIAKLRTDGHFQGEITPFPEIEKSQKIKTAYFYIKNPN